MAAPLPLTRRKAGRFWIILACLLCLGSAVALILNALSGTIIFFMAPSQLLSHPPAPSQTIRLGGMVVAGSLLSHHDSDNTPEARFDVTDGQAAITVQYRGILPDLFREGQSVVALGHMAPDHHTTTASPTLTAQGQRRDQQTSSAPLFIASEVLAKHDETYMPKDVADALQKSGKWDPRFGPPPDAASWNRMTAPQQPAQSGKAGHSATGTTAPSSAASTRTPTQTTIKTTTGITAEHPARPPVPAAMPGSSTGQASSAPTGKSD